MGKREDMMELKLEEFGVNPEKIEEFINDFNADDDRIPPPIGSVEDQLIELQIALDNTPKSNWRRRAQLAARIISTKL